MAIDTRRKRQAICNIIGRLSMGIPYGVPGIDASERANTSFEYNFFGGFSATGFFFDVRIMNRAVAQSNGEATNPDNLGTIHYTYDDMKKNDGKVTLPFG